MKKKVFLFDSLSDMVLLGDLNSSSELGDRDGDCDSGSDTTLFFLIVSGGTFRLSVIFVFELFGGLLILISVDC